MGASRLPEGPGVWQSAADGLIDLDQVLWVEGNWGDLADPEANCWTDCLRPATRGKRIFYAYILSIIDFHLAQPERNSIRPFLLLSFVPMLCVFYLCGHLCASTWVHSVSVCLLGKHAHPHCCLDLETWSRSSKHHLWWTTRCGSS